MVTLECNICHKMYDQKPYRLNVAKYCSRKCKGMAARTTEEYRFFKNISILENGCWEWTGAKTGSSYGAIQISTKRKVVLAHRLAFYMAYGYYPNEIDHTCFKTDCVNPKHLEDVTHDENMKRSDVKRGIRSQKTHCPRNHEYNEENTYYNASSNRRTCRTCMREVYIPKYLSKRKELVNA